MKTLTSIFLGCGKPLKVQAEEAIISRGNRMARVFLVQSGQVLLHSSSLWGREIVFEIVKSQEIFGFLTAIKDMKAIVDATALTACELLVLDRETFDRAIRTDPNAAVETLDFVVKRLIRRTRQAEELALHSLRGRLARWLLALAHEQGSGRHKQPVVRLDFNQRLMAAMAGVSRETLNRQFKSWTEAGIVKLEGKDLRILKPDALATLAGPGEESRWS